MNIVERIGKELSPVKRNVDFEIGDTVADFENPEGWPPIRIEEPTMSMVFTINNSPFFGKEGKFVTSRHLRDRLYKETEKNLALRVEDTESPDALLVFGRGRFREILRNIFLFFSQEIFRRRQYLQRFSI